MAMREKENERERNCRRGIAAVLAAYGYKDDDDLQTNLDFLEALKKRMKEEKMKLKIKIKIRANPTTSEEKEEEDSSNITTDYNKRMDKGKSVIITEDDEQAGSSSGRRVNKRPRQYYDDDYNYSTDVQHNKRRNIEKQSSVVKKGFEYKQRRFNIEYLNRFVEDNNGSNLELVIEKELTATDIAKNNGRLAMPFGQLSKNNQEFLTQEEKGVLDWGQEEMDVRFFDSKMHKIEGMKLRQWNMNNSKGYVLRTMWNQVVRENQLEPGMPVQLWSFRIQQRLCFALLLS